MNEVMNRTGKESAVKKQSIKKIKSTVSTGKITLNRKSAVVLIVILLLAVIFGISSCGVSHRSPKSVVKSLVEAYTDNNTRKALKCFGTVKEAGEDLKTEVDATIKYFKAHDAKKVEIDACDILSENEEYAYVYILYDFIMDDEQVYPCISTYMVKNESGKYYVVSPAEVTAEMSEQAVVDYQKFMTTDIYKKYTQEYETFTKKNPGYEEKIAGKIR